MKHKAIMIQRWGTAADEAFIARERGVAPACIAIEITRMRALLAGVLALGAAAPAWAQSPAASTAQIVRERMTAEILAPKEYAGGSPGATPMHGPAPMSPAGLLRAQNPDGSWSDINYASRSRSLWGPAEHLHRLLALAVAEHDAHPPAPPAVLRAAVLRGLKFWIGRDPQSDNWWQNTIGMQQALAPVLVLARDDLRRRAPEVWTGACALLARSHVDRMTGTNLVWEAGNLFVLGALTDDEAMMRRMIGLIVGEVRVTTAEGVQPDDSFHQHGPQLNAGNYGLSFVPSAATYALLVKGTPLAFPPSAIAVLSRFEAGFQEWVVWGRYLDLSSCGRQIDEENAQTGKARAIAQAGLLLGELDPASAPHWRRFADRVAGTLPPGAGAPRGDRYYWRSDFLVHRPGAWYFSVKMYSPRVLRTETQINDENYRGYHLCDGMTQLMVRGDEYDNIQPVWDWRKLPGITFKQTTAPFPYGRKVSQTNPCPFVGGAEFAPVGVAAMDIRKEDLTAQKAYFCFPDGIVCLGEDIACPSPAPVYTDVNQCLLRGSVVTLSPQAVWHDQVAYVRMDDTPWTYTAGPQTGSWALLRKEGASPDKVTMNVFNLWLEHGTAPTHAHYAYAILPRMSQDRARQWLKRPRLRVVSNGIVQAVADDAHKLVAAVFHGPGTVPGFGAAASFYADAPCIVIARTSVPGHIAFAVADPTQKLKEVHLIAVGLKKITVTLPTGAKAGSTVVVIE
ncbi:MAG TPA: polysaccharide lyase family 8 super-sandwich domain-containing protein [Opitutaceae bacterium]|nr:polysaccharide lyase family 8 super-sandwich domain-containing protein [Opitutaceae bacterium]